MININLLPYHLRPVKRSPLPYILSVAVAALVVLVLAGIWVGNLHKISAKRAEVAKHQLEYDELKPIVDEFQRIEQQKVLLADKIAIINEILSDRIIWSRQLWNISRLTPDNFWFSSIAEKERPIKEMRMVYDEKTKKEELKSVTVKRRVLEIGGYVIAGEDGSSDIYPLTFNMEKDEEFSKLFQLSLPKLLDTEFEGFKVRSFTLEYMINTGAEGA